MTDSAQDAETVLRAIPQENHEALRAMVRCMRLLAAAEGHFTEDDLINLYRRERAVNEQLREALGLASERLAEYERIDEILAETLARLRANTPAETDG